jgi:hypothetical protein
MGEGARTR